MTFEIPINISLPQIFNVSLANVLYTFTVYWNNQPDGGWILDIDLAATGAAIAHSLPLVTGAKITSGLEYLDLGGFLFIDNPSNNGVVADFDNLGSDVKLCFTTDS